MKTVLKKLTNALIIYCFLSLYPSLSFGSNFLCRPWINVLTGEEIGASFTSKISDGVISFLGSERPVALAQLIYSHPLNDIFIAASGELVTASIEEEQVIIDVFFPQKEVRFFVRTRCRGV